jgi:hypothetical protein
VFWLYCFKFLSLFAGTGRAAETYKCGKKTTDITLDILNLDKREVVTIDIISNQEFTEVFPFYGEPKTSFTSIMLVFTEIK